LRGFCFAPGGKSFYYVHEAVDAERPFRRAAYHHVLGTRPDEDREIFFAGEDARSRLFLCADGPYLVFLVHHFREKTLTDIYLKALDRDENPVPIFRGISYSLGLRMVGDRILALTDRDAPNRRIVEIHLRKDQRHEWVDIVPETDASIRTWHVARDRIFVSCTKNAKQSIRVFDFSGKQMGQIDIPDEETVRIVGCSQADDELLLETESFTKPVEILRYSTETNHRRPWAKRTGPIDPSHYGHVQVWYRSKDGTQIPMYLAGRREVLAGSHSPTILTSYGGYGVSMTPQFSVFVAYLMERGCVFALPNIRGGSEFGIEWHEAAKRRNRQTAYDDFLSAAHWLIDSGRTASGRLAIFGGSNSGLLVGAALTQRPDLFCAVVCMVPMLDMLRYHLFDYAYIWRDEFGCAEDPEDFAVLAKYSPYHQVRHGTAYPATMIVSGDADQNCNPLHARKMTARLQAANISGHPIFLDYSKFRGHSPVLPLSVRIEALTDRMAFLCDQLQLSF
jgi:prolyl oligopeptidase